MTIRQLIASVLLVVIIAALVGAAALVFSNAQSQEYESSAQLLFGPPATAYQILGVPAANQDQQTAINSDVLDVGSFDIARRTAGALPNAGLTPGQVANRVKASAARGSDVITIRAQAPTPQASAQLAQTYLEQYLATSKQRVIARAFQARRALENALKRLPPRAIRGAREDSLRYQLGVLAVYQRTGNAPEIIQGVRTSGSAVIPQTSRNVLFGLLFGAVLAIALLAARGALASDRRDPREHAAP